MCTNRKDAVAFVSPEIADVVNVATEEHVTANVKAFFDALPSTSYAFLTVDGNTPTTSTMILIGMFH